MRAISASSAAADAAPSHGYPDDHELRASEIRYRHLFEAARDGILMLDAGSGEITAVNPFLADLIGYSRAEILGKKLWELSPFADVTKCKIAFEELQRQEYIRYDDLPLETRDGRSIAVEFVSNRYVLADENVIQCTLRDITERKRAETAGQASDVRYRALFEYALDGILIADPRGCYADANASTCRMLGYSRDELIGMSGTDIVVPAEVPHIDEALAAIGLTASHQRQWQFRRKDGSSFPADVMVTVMPDGCLLAMIRDVTERNAVHEALLTAEERMRFALQSANVGVWDMDCRSGVNQWSEGMEAQYGLVPGTFPGTFEAFVGHIDPRDRESVLEIIGNAMKAGSDFSVLHRVVLPDRSLRWLSGTGRIHLDELGRPLRALGISQDVTASRSLEAQFQQAQKMEAVGRLAGSVAHDFNNLLTVILGFCELLLAEAAPGDPRRDDLQEIQKAGARATQLTRQLLAFSRKEIIEPTLLDLNVVLRDLKPMLRRLIREDVNLVFGFAPGLALVKADRGQVQQVVVNLAVNAQDAMPGGGILRIETANCKLDDHYAAMHFGVKPGSYVVLTVTDSGTGMTVEVRERLFEPFFTTKGVGKGTGLGLSTVHGIVTRCGGSVNVDSEVGHGTSLKVYLPETQSAEPNVAVGTKGGPLRRGTETVLVVEDAAGLRELTKRLLERLGYSVLVAANADEGIRLFDQNPSIQLMLTDVIMPGRSGPDLAEYLVTRRPGMKVVYMSGYTDDTIVQHGVLKPGIAFLHKPFTGDALGRKIREVLDG